MSRTLMVLSAVIVLSLGTLHLFFTYSGPKLLPRDPSLQTRMSEVAPVITRQTTMWRAWIGFNVSHSLGLLLFGLLYGYLAVVEPDLLFRSWFLLLIGFAMLSSYMVLAWAYWFYNPLIGIAIASVLFAASAIVARI